MSQERHLLHIANLGAGEQQGPLRPCLILLAEVGLHSEEELRAHAGQHVPGSALHSLHTRPLLTCKLVATQGKEVK